MSIAEKEKFSDYASFNEFFIRPLKENARPINQNLTALLSFFTLVTASKIINENYYQNTSIRLVSL